MEVMKASFRDENIDTTHTHTRALKMYEGFLLCVIAINAECTTYIFSSAPPQKKNIYIHIQTKQLI